MWAFLFCVAAAVGAGMGATESCDVTIGGDTYRTQTLISDVSLPQGLAVDYTTNLLYCSYHRRSVWFSVKINLRTKELSELKELPGLCSFAVDRATQTVYAGCINEVNDRARGLYQLDPNVGRFVLVGEAGQRVVFAYYSDQLYYSTKYLFLLHTFREGLSSRVENATWKIQGMVIDNNKDWIFYNKSGLYRQPAGAGEATHYDQFYWPRALALDTRGDVHLCDWYTGIYRLHEQTLNATKLLDAKRCTGLAFDGDNNIIYGDMYIEKIFWLVKC